MFDQILCRLPGSQVLVALADRFVLAAAIVALGHQYGNLGAQFRQFEGTCDYRDCGTRVDTCQPEARNRRKRRPRIPGISDNKRGASGSLVNPIVERVLGSLVYGEGHGADEGYACERRPDTTIEAMEAFSFVGVANAVGEGVELVGLQAGLDRVERISRKCREQTAGARSDLGALLLGPSLGLLTALDGS